MATILGNVGTGSATSDTTLVIPITSSVAQSTPSLGIAVLIFYDTDAPDSAVVTDDATGGVGYGGIPNPQGVGAGSEIAFGHVDSLCIVNPLTTSNSITLTFDTVFNYVRATAYAVSGVVTGVCTAINDSANNQQVSDGGAGFWVSGSTWSLSTPPGGSVALTGFHILGQAALPTTSLVWTDSGISLLEGWYAQGPDQLSMIIGTRAVSNPATSYDILGTSDQVDPSHQDMWGTVCWMADLTPPTYCAVAGNPVFNNRMRLSI